MCNKCCCKVRQDKSNTQKHGQWFINPDGYYPYCSECYEEPNGGEMTRFCPNCGAKMDRGGKNNA